MTWGMVAVAAATVVAGVMQKNSANKAAKAQKNAANSAISASQANYANTANDLNPYISAGKNALGQMQALNSGDFSSFKQSPDYQFRFDQGIQGLDRSAASRGSLYSGGHSADLMSFGQGLASQSYGDYYNRLAGLAQSGQGAASNLGSVGTGNAASIGGYMQAAGNAQANGYINNANANANMVGGLAGAFGQYMGSRPATSSSYSLGGSGTAPYANVNNGEWNPSGGYNLATAGTGTGH